MKSAPSTEMLLAMPFWPLMVSSSPSGPCTMLTPGVSLVKSRKLRPLLGSPRMAASSMRFAPSARDVSTSGAAAVTTTCSWTADTLSVSGRLIVCPTARSIPSRTSVAKPVMVTVTR